jgi:fumarylacetoacetase
MSSSWLDVDLESPFSLANIPFGIISTSSAPAPRPAIAIGEFALDLKTFSSRDGFKGLPSISKDISVFSSPTLNAFAALGQKIHGEVRKYMQAVLSKDGPYKEILEQDKVFQSEVLVPLKSVKYHLPMTIGDYTDFYAGKNHAYNVNLNYTMI